MTEQKSDRSRKTLTIAEVKSGAVTMPIIYGLSNSERGIFYVGQSINMKRRLYHYTNPVNCHNIELGEYLTANPDFDVEILEHNPDDLSVSELMHINKRIGSIFNISLNPHIAGRVRSYSPWNAGSGRRCPSSYLMWMAARASNKGLKESFKEVLGVIGKMSIPERCAFEVSVYKDMDDFTKRILSDWLKLTRDGMLSAMECESG